MTILTMQEDVYVEAAATSLSSLLNLRDKGKRQLLEREIALIVRDVKQACGVKEVEGRKLPRICFECNGRGLVRVGQHWYSAGYDIKCDYCKGTGKLNF